MPELAIDPKVIISVPSPFYQVTGGQIYQILVETNAAQVSMADGISVETRINTIERAISGIRVTIVASTIEDRDALIGKGVNAGDRVYVLDASGDESVESGGADYMFMTDGTWLKLSEWESMDVLLKWENIEGRPTATPEQIDLAVAKAHSHDNIETLTHLSTSEEGTLHFKGKPVSDGKVWIASVSSLADIPPNLADGGLVILLAPESEEEPEEPETDPESGNE